LLNAMIRQLKSDDLDVILRDLLAAGIVKEVKVEKSGPGRKPKVYIHKEFA